MRAEPNKRPRRVPFTPEEVANIIAAKKRREFNKLLGFKKSGTYKWQNIFNVVCFFIYWEIIFCFFGPANYYRHYTISCNVQYGNSYDLQGKPTVSEIIFNGVNGKAYNYVVNDFVESPDRFTSFTIGRDFLLQKDLKGKYGSSDREYRLFATSPVLLLIFIAVITSSVAYLYNLNVESYSLMAVTVLNGLTMLGVFFF